MKLRSSIALSLAGSALLFATSAYAQATLPAPPVPPMACENPGNPPANSSPAMARFQKKVDEYKVCVNDYAKTTGAKANEYADAARAYSNAANEAIDGYNTYIKALNEKTNSTK